MIVEPVQVGSIASEGESEVLEYKKSTAQLKAAAETLCGFLNGDGGKVIIGITPKERKVLGQQVADKTQNEIGVTLRRFEPPAPIKVEYEPLANSDKKLIVLRALPARETRPYTYDNRPYYRIETTTSVMPQELYNRLLLERSSAYHRWENMPATGADISHLDQEEILRTARLSISAGRLPESATTNPVDLLNRFGLRKDGELLNAAVVLFGTHFLPEHPQCQLRMARFKGTDKTEFIDNQQITGHGFQLLNEAMVFLRRHLPVAGRVQPGLFERVDEPLFPLVALREALVNAVCHRDYSRPGGSVSLAIYDNRLEIWSDGTLPYDISVEDLKHEHTSHLRNPLIAGVLFKRKLVESWGRGTQMIVELCVKAGHPEPEFIEHAGSVGVRFLPSGYIAPHRVALNLTTRQREILHILAGGNVPLRYIVKRLVNPPSEAAVRADLSRLKNLGLADNNEKRGMGALWFLGQNSPN